MALPNTAYWADGTKVQTADGSTGAADTGVETNPSESRNPEHPKQRVVYSTGCQWECCLLMNRERSDDL